jgi:hypothetical protein
MSRPNVSHCKPPRSYQTLHTSCMPFPMPTSAIAHPLARARPYAPSACHIPSQYQPLLASSLVSDPTHQLHTISDRNISHYSSPHRCQTLRTFCMPYPIQISAIARLLARTTPHAPSACHVPSQCQPLLFSWLVSNPTHKLHAMSHPSVSHCSSPRSYQTLHTSCMPYPILISVIARLLARIRPYAPAACHIPSQRQPLLNSSLISEPTHPLHAISDPNISHCASLR